MDIRAQYAVEFMLIFAFSLAIIIPIVSIMNTKYQESKQDLDIAQARIVLDEITAAAQKTFYAGYPSRTTLELYFPHGIKGIRSYNASSDRPRSEIEFNVSVGRGASSIHTVVPFIVNISIRPNEGRRKIIVKAEKADYINITE